MGSKLRKKRVMKPDGYGERFRMQQRRKAEKMAEDCFVEVFYSLQYVSLSALWIGREDGGMDFSEAELKRFNERMKEKSGSYDFLGGMSMAMEKLHKKQIGFDCHAEARKFPFRAKVKMYGKPLKTRMDYQIAAENAADAVEEYLILSLHTLREDFHFSGEMVWAWWNKSLEIAGLYADGMTDEFIIRYLEEDSGMPIERE